MEPQYREFIQPLLIDFSEQLASECFAQRARHPDCPQAFTRKLRLLATHLQASDFPTECFGDLYHARWRVEEAFKRVKPHARCA